MYNIPPDELATQQREAQDSRVPHPWRIIDQWEEEGVPIRLLANGEFMRLEWYCDQVFTKGFDSWEPYQGATPCLMARIRQLKST